ncbi:LOB domain-containing protein 28-like isoform X2 [Wolffia australiana]
MSSSNSRSSITSANSQPSFLHHSRRSSAGGSSSAACAACKYQRRKCNPDCTLAPYFPADHQRYFLNAHRLFGVSNILKTIRSLSPEQTAAAMRNIVIQSNMRAQDPVGGCYRVILELQRSIQAASSELDGYLQQLVVLRPPVQNVIPRRLMHDEMSLSGHPIPEHSDLQYYCGEGEGSNVLAQNHEEEIGIEPPLSPPSFRMCTSESGRNLQQERNVEFVEDKPSMDMFGMGPSQMTDFLEILNRDVEPKPQSSLEYRMTKLEMAGDEESVRGGEVEEQNLNNASTTLKLTTE